MNIFPSDKFHNVLDYLEGNCTELDLEYIRYDSWTDPETCFSDEMFQLARRFVGLLKSEGLDFEERDDNGRTWFLSLSCGYQGFKSLQMARLLLEHGANVHAADSEGNNAIQLVLSSTEVFSHNVEEKLTFLVGAGVDVHHRNKNSQTPSMLALVFNFWDEWCQALKNNGIDIDEVLLAEEDLWDLAGAALKTALKTAKKKPKRTPWQTIVALHRQFNEIGDDS